MVKYVYDAWGNHKVLDASGNAITSLWHIGHLNPFRYRGYYYDTETGLYYLKSRYYDPVACRFISADDLAYVDPDHVNGTNLYAYCNNNPVMNVDPDGKNWWRRFWGSTAGAITKVVLGVVIVAALGVATVFTGGAVGAVVTGAFLGAATAGISSAVIGIATGQSFSDFADSFLSGIIIGGISGAISGIGSPTSIFQSLGYQMLANAAISGAAYLIDSAINNSKPSLSTFIFNVGMGAVGGAAPAGLRGVIASVSLDYLSGFFERKQDGLIAS